MKYKITQESDHFRADCLTMPGSPPCGFGKTEAEAVIHLLERLVNERMGPNDPNWTKHFDPSFIEVNGEKWAWPQSFLKG